LRGHQLQYSRLPGQIEGIWSLLRSWLRPHRGISQEKLPLYIGFFQFVHKARQHGIGLLEPLLAVLLTPTARNPLTKSNSKYDLKNNLLLNHHMFLAAWSSA
jgi:hypothetical protein